MSDVRDYGLGPTEPEDGAIPTVQVIFDVDLFEQVNSIRERAGTITAFFEEHRDTFTRERDEAIDLMATLDTFGKRIQAAIHDTAPNCPNCGSKTLAEAAVRVTNPRLKGGHGLARYINCCACPWASPALTVADSGSEA